MSTKKEYLTKQQAEYLEFLNEKGITNPSWFQNRLLKAEFPKWQYDKWFNKLSDDAKMKEIDRIKEFWKAQEDKFY